MLDAVIAWAPNVICPKEPLNATPRYIKEHMNGKYMPFFKDAFGALDGTHIHCIVDKHSHLAYRCGRDPRYTTHNVLGVCDFNMRFTFVSAGWEGIAHDCKVLIHALSDPKHNFPHPTGG